MRTMRSLRAHQHPLCLCQYLGQACPGVCLHPAEGEGSLGSAESAWDLRCLRWVAQQLVAPHRWGWTCGWSGAGYTAACFDLNLLDFI